MIVSFAHPGLQHLFETGDWSQIQAPDVPKIRRILARLHRARIPADMDVPGFHLAPARHAAPDLWSVTVRRPYLILFCMRDGNAHDANLSANY